MINEIKASMPIWKKEVYASGEVRKENSEFLRMRSSVRVSKIRIPQVHRKVKRVEAERLEDKKICVLKIVGCSSLWVRQSNF